MKKLLNGVDYELIQGSLCSVQNIVIDSREASEKTLFVCLSGSNVDSHNFIYDAYKLGCKNFLVEKIINLNIKDANIIKVDNTRKSLSLIAQNLYNNPASELITIGITGTKGKTTTAEMIKTIIESAGEKCGLIGTLGVFIGDKKYKTLNTTPESLDIQKFFREMVDEGCKYVVMEVSSQALKYGRVYGLNFDYGVFTNLSLDHIGENEHIDYDDYKNSKSILFKQCKKGIFNIDDNDYDYMIKDATCDIKTFGIDGDDFKIQKYSFLQEHGKLGMSFNVNDYSFKIFTPGKFSMYNAACAFSVTSSLGISYDIIYDVLINFKVKGRVEPVKISDNFNLLIDYAHEAMSLESLLTTIKEYNPKRIVTLFGCGGNRSKFRRYEMGEISGKYSDLTVLTEDNSRFENVLDIIEDIKVGLNKTNGEYVVIPNRKMAIKYVIEHALNGDVILLCGKGHEDYQEINGQRFDMDERKLINEVLTELKENKGEKKY